MANSSFYCSGLIGNESSFWRVLHCDGEVWAGHRCGDCCHSASSVALVSVLDFADDVAGVDDAAAAVGEGSSGLPRSEPSTPFGHNCHA